MSYATLPHRLGALLAACLGLGSLLEGCGAKTTTQGGLMLEVGTDGTLIDRVDIQIRAEDQTLLDNSYDVPAETSLPTTVGIVSNGHSASIVNIAVVGWHDRTPIDRRDFIVTQVPVDRIAALRIVLTSRCSAKVALKDGKAVTTCEPGETCDPGVDACIDSTVASSTLPNYTPTVEISGSAGSGGQPGKAGQGEAADSGASGEGGSGVVVPECSCGAHASCVSFDSSVCACDSGYEGDGQTCAAIDACATNHGGCDSHGDCVVTGPGTNGCACQVGYAGDGRTCAVIVTCGTNHGGCDSHADCVAAGPGTNGCACQVGYAGDGRTCAAIDACATNHGGCDSHADCTKTGPGTSTCACKTGYSGDGKTCAPIDQCALNLGGCDTHANCLSTGPGTNSCTCKPGYSGTGKVCAAVNTCQTNNGGCNAALPCISTGAGTNSCLTVTQITTGDAFTCARMSNGTLRCWGFNQFGQLGNNGLPGPTPPGPNQFASPQLVRDSNAMPLKNVNSASGGSFFTCSVLSGGQVVCWGANDSGALGDGTTKQNFYPVTAIASGSVAVSAGYIHTCAVSATDVIRCWGGNPYGQLGTGGTADSLFPTTVIASGGVSVSAGSFDTCAVLSGGVLKCWGNNTWGQIGDGTQIDRSSPSVTSLTGVQSVAVGSGHACALYGSGQVACWGRNDAGQVGNGTTTQQLLPVNIIASGALGVAVNTNDYAPGHSCAVFVTGSVKCWGSNGFGQLGDGTTTDRSTPVLAIASGAVAVACGTRHSCALLQDGSLRCWGDNQYGATAGASTATSVVISQ